MIENLLKTSAVAALLALGGASASQAGFLLEGAKPLVVKPCITQAERDQMRLSQPSYRVEADKRPICKPGERRPTKPGQARPTKPGSGPVKVPQK